MPGHNLARHQLNPAQMDALPPGSHVIDGSMDISTKRADGQWTSPIALAHISTATLHRKHGPIKLWTGTH